MNYTLERAVLKIQPKVLLQFQKCDLDPRLTNVAA
jgi:hypothetical protein